MECDDHCFTIRTQFRWDQRAELLYVLQLRVSVDSECLKDFHEKLEFVSNAGGIDSCFDLFSASNGLARSKVQE